MRQGVLGVCDIGGHALPLPCINGLCLGRSVSTPPQPTRGPRLCLWHRGRKGRACARNANDTPRQRVETFLANLESSHG